MNVSGEDEADRSRRGSGIEHPEHLRPEGGPITIERTFAFVDLSGFTAFIEERGDAEAVQVLALFRLRTSEVAARRGIRVAKWLGDGAMLVGVHSGPTVAAVAEMMARVDQLELKIRAGVAAGGVILFQGDDYIGRTVNLAARLCDAAEPGSMLATAEVAEDAPEWVTCSPAAPVVLRGVGSVTSVCSLAVADHVTLPPVPVARS